MNGMRLPDDAEDFLLPLYVEREMPDAHGVWWEDEHGPMSAPRGVIVPSKMPDISIT